MISIGGYKEYNKPIITLTNEDRNFVELINNRITIYGQIPYTVPEKLIIDLIKESALYFYRMGYWRSQQTIFYRVSKEDILEFLRNDCSDSNGKCKISKCIDYPNCNNPEHNENTHHLHLDGSLKNIKGYGLTLPGYINTVIEVYQTNKSKIKVDEDVFDSSGELWARSGYGKGMVGINSNLYMLEKTVKMVEENNWTSIHGTSIPVSFNNITKTLLILGNLGDNFRSLILKCDSNVPVQYLYQDDMFIKYVVGRTKQELKRILGSHTLQLPGDVQLNADEICANADSEVEKVEEKLQASSGIGDIILTRD